MRRSRLIFTLAVLAGVWLAGRIRADETPFGKAAGRSAPPKQRGIALGLYSEDPDWSYVDMLQEMKAAGASHVAITVPWYMKTAVDTEIFDHPRYTVPMKTVERTVRDARALGLEIFLFPILRVEDETHGWRGALKPGNIDEFFKNYLEFIMRFARLAAEMKIPLLSIGSELSTMEIHEGKWRTIIAKVREVYPGELTYSANWDHFEQVKFFDALDYAGTTGYFELAREGENPTVEELVHSWRNVYFSVMRWRHRVNKPLIFTEVGYLSQKNTAAWPWKEGADEQLDLEIQRRCYEAFRRVWNDEPLLAGVYFWNWFGWGGPTSKEYTPRGKPAANEIKTWFLGGEAGGLF